MYAEVIAATAAAFAFASTHPVLPLYVVSTGHPRTLIATMNMTHNVTQVLARPFFGHLADRYDPRVFVAAGLAAYGLSTVLCYVPHTAAFLGSRVLLGLGMGLLWPPLLASVAAKSKGREGLFFGSFNSIFQSAMVFGPPLGGLAYSHMGGEAFLLLGAPALASIPSALAVKRSKSGGRGRRGCLPELPDLPLLLASLPAAATAALQPTVEFFVPLLLKSMGAGPGTIGLVLAARNAVAVFSQAPCGHLADKMSPRFTASLGSALAGFTLALCPFVGNPLAVAALLCLGALGYGLSQPASMKMAATSGEGTAGRMGWWGSVMAMGRIAGSAAGYAVAISLPAVFELTGALAIAAAAIVGVCGICGRRREERS